MAGPPGRAGATTDTLLSVTLLPGRFRAVILDLDGLLVQTEHLWSRAKELLFARYGTDFRRDDHLAVFGTSERHTARVFTRRLGLSAEREDDIRREYLGLAAELFAGDVPVSPGAPELLAALRGRVPLGLASNTRRELVLRILSGADMGDAFEVVVTGDEGSPKPAPDLYLLACERLRVAPADAVALEDSPTGVAAARAAGLTVIGIPSAREVPLPEADHVVGSLLDLVPPAGVASAADGVPAGGSVSA